MKESKYINEHYEEESLVIKDVIIRYLQYWPWFICTVILALFMGYLYVRYAPVKYASIAKIKIVDDEKELDISADPLAALGGGAKINLDNEIEVIKSYRLLSQVVDDLKLDVIYKEIGQVKSTEMWNAPFEVFKNIPEDSIKNSLEFRIKLSEEGFHVIDDQDNEYNVPYSEAGNEIGGLPFKIELNPNAELALFEDFNFGLVLIKRKEAFQRLSKALTVQPTNKKSEILSLSIIGESFEKSEAVVNAIVTKFDEDGILDRQLVSKRTLDFIDERFVFLSRELDSIEFGKQDFKKNNNLSYIEEDATIALQQKSENEQEVFNLETQVSISKLLGNTITKEANYRLLPSDIGLENNSINNLVANYNTLVLEREKIKTSVGESHPTLLALNNQLERAKQNILNTVKVYRTQLQMTLGQRRKEQNRASSSFSRLPEKEKILRSIERQQSIKENLFLLLLQKREEAAISFAVTAPSIKVVDYGLTNSKPVSPKKSLVYPIALGMGLLLPFVILFIRFQLDTKIYDRTAIEKLNPEIPILAEIPFIEDVKLMQRDDRSILGESFRILSTNINYLLPQKETNSKVIYVTSTVKNEGKTLMSLNLSLAYASLKKKTLLIGADLRNPQLHSYLDEDKNAIGLSDFLSNESVKFEDCISSFNDDSYHKVCYSGHIPPNASQLLSNEAFTKFIEMAKSEFDYIIVDTAPTLLVTDTLLIADHADLTLFITRAGFTETRLLEFSKELNKTKRLKNMAYVVNSVDHGKFKGYNYGYGYGYGEEIKKGVWYEEAFRQAGLGWEKAKKYFKLLRRNNS